MMLSTTRVFPSISRLAPVQRCILQHLSTRNISIHRLSGSIGAEIHDVDLAQDLPENPGLVRELRESLLEHKVIFFRNQNLEPDSFLNFASHFGKPIEYPFVRGLDNFPAIIQVFKQEHETVNFGGVWHSDTSYFDQPPMGSILLAKDIPPYGGDTLFANQYAAYEALSDGLKHTLSTLNGVNTSAKADVSKTREDRVRDSGNANANTNYEAIHPVVRTHPETGRKALYVNTAHTARFEGWTEDESAPLLQYLFTHQVKPEFTCRFRWDVGSIAFWDNRCAQHYPVNDYHGFRRRMLRITLAGDKPV
ncbi:taurine dioxygenase [Exophiala viscosa]|uniref:Taurine dioxygenase n=1 Tax=Exophiala viscosa TaxID=2486360 RepID=A0AAN6E3W6_9EURO|nr:taurine dioxygenase [Exophiala viscosa]KAI1626818.1 taurine dioxygenase [Exophiala viscosa]